jgi:hypothetical protein
VPHVKIEANIKEHVLFGVEGAIEFTRTNPTAMSIRLEHRGRPDTSTGRTVAGSICIASMVIDIDDAAKAEIARCINSGEINVEKIGHATLKLLDEKFGTLEVQEEAAFKIYRWRHGILGPVDSFAETTGFYSEDGEHWARFAVHRVAGIRIEVGAATLALRADDIKGLSEMMERNVEEPLGHQLFREAWTQRVSNPRSALAIGVAALEVGVKELIGKLVPEANWLVEQLQAPPVWRILRDFVPTLRPRVWLRGKTFDLPKELLTQIHKAVEARNGLVHRGEPPPVREELTQMLKAIRDVLWICDLYGGEGWAANLISGETLARWSK